MFAYFVLIFHSSFHYKILYAYTAASFIPTFLPFIAIYFFFFLLFANNLGEINKSVCKA